jgi:Recombination endonuclease VII
MTNRERCATYYKANHAALSRKRRAFYLKNKKRIIAKRRAYVKDNKAKLRIADAQYYKTNRAAILAQKKQYLAANADAIHELKRSRYQANRTKICEQTAAWRSANPTKVHALKLKRYGITLEQWNAMLIAQGGRCWLCDKPMMGKKDPAVDHDHETNVVRGLAHQICNLVFGLLDEDPELFALFAERATTARRDRLKILTGGVA